MSLPLYSDDFSRLLAVIKADRVFMDDRKVGFFRVKLLPVVVAQDVRINMSNAYYATNLLSAFRSNLVPMAKRGPIEWRNVSISVDGEGGPRLRAGRVTPPSAGADFCAVDNATFQVGSETITMHHARLLLQAKRAQLCWEEGGVKHFWDFTSSTPIATRDQQTVKPL